MSRRALIVITSLLIPLCLAMPNRTVYAAACIEGSWSGTISAKGRSASASVTFSSSGAYSITGGGYSSSGRYSCASGSITLTPFIPSGIGSVTMSMTLSGNKCTISGSVMGISGTLSISRIGLSLTEAAIDMETGESYVLTTGSGKSSLYKRLIWVSSDPAIASVSDTGEITALSEGITSITVTGQNGDSASCLVSVRPPDGAMTESSRYQSLSSLWQALFSALILITSNGANNP